MDNSLPKTGTQKPESATSSNRISGVSEESDWVDLPTDRAQGRNSFSRPGEGRIYSEGSGFVRENTFNSTLTEVIEEVDETESKENSRPTSPELERLERVRDGGGYVSREPFPAGVSGTSETVDAIATAEALTELIEERLNRIRGNAESSHKLEKFRNSPLLDLKLGRPQSGHSLTGPPLSGEGSRTLSRNRSGTPTGRPLSGSTGRPVSASRLTKRPQSGSSSLRSTNGAADTPKRSLSSREARLNAQNIGRPPNALANYILSRPSTGSSKPEAGTYLPHTGPRPSFQSFFEVSDTVTRIRKWSQAKYRAHRKVDSRNSLDSRKRTRSSDSRRSRNSNRKQEMAESAQSGLTAEAAAHRRRTRTFAWYSRVIKAVVKLCLDMQKLSVQKTEQTPISEMYYINISGPSASEDPTQQLFFDKSWFSRKRATSRVPLWAQAVTIKPPKERGIEDINRLHTLLLNMRSFKEKFTEDMRLKMCEVMRYTQCDKGRVILRQGHYGQDFYFIYSGSVFIQIDMEDPDTGHITTTTENVIRNGESFGEIALLGDGERSACVICREPTELFQIDKTTFMEICPGIFKVELTEKMQFAKKFAIFKGWDPETFESLCFNSQVLYIPHGRNIEPDWSKSNYVYFVMKGRISLLKDFEVSDMLDLTAKGMMDKELHYRKPENDEAAHRRKQAYVGSIGKNEFSDLRILSIEPSSSIANICLQSEGVKVFRVAVRTFKRMCPRKMVEEYLKKEYVPFEIPSNGEICEKVFRDSIWTSYKRSVLRTVELEQSGFAIAHLPSTVKGTSGWARWPGFDDEAEEKTGRLMIKNNRSYVDPFLIVKTPNRKTHPAAPEVQQKPTERVREDRSSHADIIVETEEEHGILPIVINNDRSMICKPRGITNVMELRKSVNRFNREDMRTQLQSASGESGKSVFLTEPAKEYTESEKS